MAGRASKRPGVSTSRWRSLPLDRRHPSAPGRAPLVGVRWRARGRRLVPRRSATWPDVARLLWMHPDGGRTGSRPRRDLREGDRWGPVRRRSWRDRPGRLGRAAVARRLEQESRCWQARPKLARHGCPAANPGGRRHEQPGDNVPAGTKHRLPDVSRATIGPPGKHPRLDSEPPRKRSKRSSSPSSSTR